MEPLLLESIEKVRGLVQIPEGDSRGVIRARGALPRVDELGFTDILARDYRRSSWPHKVTSSIAGIAIDRATALAESVTDTFGPKVTVSVKDTIEKSDWLEEHSTEAIRAASFMAHLHLTCVRQGNMKAEDVDPQIVLAQTVAEYIAGRSIAPETTPASINGQPSTYFNPFEIGELRHEFAADDLCDFRFLGALSLTALRKKRTRPFLACLVTAHGQCLFRMHIRRILPRLLCQARWPVIDERAISCYNGSIVFDESGSLGRVTRFHLDNRLHQT